MRYPVFSPRIHLASTPGKLFLLLLIALSAANIRQSALGQPVFSGARNAALGGASTAFPDDAAGQVNPAAWGQTDARFLALHGARLYGLPELQFAGFRLAIPFQKGAIAGDVSVFGFDLYRHVALGAGFGRRFGFGTHREVHTGVRAGWNQVYIANHGQAGALGLTAGVLLPITPFISLGAAAHNLTVVAGPLRSDLRRSIAVGAAWRPSESFAMTADATKEVRSPFSIATGVEIRLVEILALRGGIASGPRRASGGIGLNRAPVRADFAAQRHEILGWTPSMSLLYSW